MLKHRIATLGLSYVHIQSVPQKYVCFTGDIYVYYMF